MKKNLLVFSMIISSILTSHAQNYRLWASYYGGTDLDGGANLTTDAFGNVYLTGSTSSTSGIATAGSHQSTFGGGGGDAFLVKFNSAGTRLWATYYGGPGSDYGYGVKTDAAGNVYLVGYTSSTSGMVTAGAFQTTFNGTTDAYLVKFNSSGTRLWATYYGGSDFELAADVATDGSGNVYVAGYTVSTTDIASAGAWQTTSGGQADAFLVKFDGAGNRLWGTFYGGSDVDYGNSLATDLSGNVVICGSTSSISGIASAGGFLNTFAGNQDGFIAKFDPAGNRLWATYYGGTDAEYGNDIATGPSDEIYLCGITYSLSGISSGGFQNTFAGWQDGYLVKFDAAGNRLWGTYYGGTGIEEGESVATDAWGNVFFGGDTYSPNVGNCIATPYGYQTLITGSENHFLAAFLPNGIRVCATYYGKVHEEECHLAVNSYGDVFTEGWTYSTTGIASAGAHQSAFAGGQWDAFIVKFNGAVPRAEVNVPNDDFPPPPPTPTTTPPKIYISVAYFDKGLTTMSNVVLKNFSPSSPLPASGSAIINGTCDFNGTYSTGGSPIPLSCTANFSMKVEFQSASGSTRVYDTEMLQLDLSGSTWPAGLMLRESPALISPGNTIITDIGGGLFRMSSFFNVFTELSTDNGNTWETSTNPARMDLQNANSTNTIPTLSEWGLISLGLFLLGFGIFFIRSKPA